MQALSARKRLIGQAIYGLLYGATYGMAENEIMPRLVGDDKERLETAGFVLTASREFFSLAAALIPFAAISAGRLMGLDLPLLLWGTAGALSVILAASAALVLWPSRRRS